MPKEQINHPKIITRNEGTPNEVHEATDATCVHVGWNRAGWVQVSLSLSRERMHKWVASLTHDEPSLSLYSEVLDRGEINRLIRTLRKARDQAYGADA